MLFLKIKISWTSVTIPTVISRNPGIPTLLQLKIHNVDFDDKNIDKLQIGNNWQGVV